VGPKKSAQDATAIKNPANNEIIVDPEMIKQKRHTEKRTQ